MTDARFESHLYEARIRRGLTQEDLARQTNVSKEAIRKIEKGLSVPNVLLAVGLAALVGWAVTELFRPIQKGGNQDDGDAKTETN